MAFLYVGPNQIIPLSGFLGTAFGFVLMFWGKILRGVQKLVGLFSSKSAAAEKRSVNSRTPAS
jgi:hypothetical protein